MAVHQQLAILLPRILALKDPSPFILVLENILQSSWFFIQEMINKLPSDTNKILIRTKNYEQILFDTVIDANKVSLEKIPLLLKEKLSDGQKNVVFIDSLNQIPLDILSEFLISLLTPNATLVGIYNTSLVHNGDYARGKAVSSSYPNPLTLLSFFSTSKIKLVPAQKLSPQELEQQENELDLLIPPLACNKAVFNAELEHRRKSGRAMRASYKIDAGKHSIEYFVEKDAEAQDAPIEDPSALQGLATFNLSMTEEQKRAKEGVPLPFLQAQEVGNGGGSGGAIIYQFEKDDDYDEEDPYEDPF